MSQSEYPNLLCFLDTETTGVDYTSCHLLEVGVLFTDAQLVPLAQRSWVIQQNAYVLGGMSEWCLRQHGRSGLIADCAVSKQSQAQVAAQLLVYLHDIAQREGAREGTVPMAGCTIHFDRFVLRRLMPEVERWFYYGNLDVASVEKLARLWYPELPAWRDPGEHRVDPDNEDAVKELAYYREVLFLDQNSVYRSQAMRAALGQSRPRTDAQPVHPIDIKGGV